MTASKRPHIGALAGIALLLLSACAPAGTELANATWVLDLPEEWSDAESALVPTEVTLEFLSGEGAIRGAFGLQKYVGSYAVDGDAISFTTLCWTTMACMAAGGALNREQEYLFALEDARSYRIDGDTLSIDCGDRVLTFRRE